MPPPATAELTDEKLFVMGSMSLLVYARLVHGILPAAHHEEWIEDFEAVERGEIDRLLYIAPPGAAKTTWFRIFQEWYLGRHPQDSLLFFTSSDTNAKLYGNTLQNTLEANDRYVDIFPARGNRPDPKRGWSATDGMFLQDALKNEKDPSYRSIGYMSSSIGSRANGIGLDDPLTQEQNESETTVEAAKKKWIGTIEPRLRRMGRAWVVGIMTSWTENDFPHFLAEQFAGTPKSRIVHVRALGDDSVKPIHPSARMFPLKKGQSFWEEAFPAPWLEQKRKSIGTALFNCVPGDAALSLTSRPRHMACRWYEGRIVRVTTASGNQFSATPNHPVMAERDGVISLVNCGDLKKGMGVVSRFVQQASGLTSEHKQDAPATMEQVFGFLRTAGNRQTIHSTTDDFHGDGRDGNVDVVSIDSHLLYRLMAEFPQPFRHLCLAAPDLRRFGLNGFGSGDQMLMGFGDSLDRAPVHEAVSSGARVHPGIAELLGRRAIPGRDAPLPKPVDDGGSVAAEGAGDLLGGFPAGIALDDVVSVEFEDVRCYVYALHTDDHLFAFNSIIGGNSYWQGDPTAMGGDVFKDSKWFQPLPADFDVRGTDGKTKREKLSIVTAVDTAFSAQETAHYTAIVTLGMDEVKNLYLIGLKRGKWTPDQAIEHIAAEWSKHQSHLVGLEKAAFRQEVVKEMCRRLRALILAGVVEIDSRGDKVSRALGPALAAEHGQVYIDKDLEDAGAFIAECLGFPKAVYDDYVDGFSLGFSLLATRLGTMIDLSKLPRQKYDVGAPKPLVVRSWADLDRELERAEAAKRRKAS